MQKLPELFGSMVFNDAVMKKRLAPDIYAALKKTTEEGKPLDESVADSVAQAMKDWAVENGATHFTHWFQPMNGVTAEKHDSFLSPQKDGTAIMKFSGKALVKGESDASSFPSGGLRATFEARGYTVWDPTSHAFIKERTLCIPTAFYSYGGEALDQKTPLLRSMGALEAQAKRVLKLLGSEPDRVLPTTGAEQEYFLIDRSAYYNRRDLMFTGRTLFGARPPKGQELDDHYYGRIRLRVSDFMRDLDEELWRMGVAVITEHNEAAPAQHELACNYDTSNIACDQNALTMEVMRQVAKRHDLTCIFHEKPFEGVNGSGKHLNWSISAGGKNLLDPGSTPAENTKFLLFFSAVIKAVDEYQDLLRLSVATSGNDHRLGANEAPPAIVSVFIGDELDAILTAIEHDESYDRKDMGYLGDTVLPAIPKDTTDRNRTSPFAFTGNKFEFRMPGASAAIANANTIINTIVAESLRQFADQLEGAEDIRSAVRSLIKSTVKTHRRILFNGNGYGDEWIVEAENRGLSNYRSSAEAIPHLLDKKNIEVLSRHGIYTEKENISRCEIMLESYCKTLNIEALTMLEMAKNDILPAVIDYAGTLADHVNAKRQVSEAIPCRAEMELLTQISTLTDRFYDGIGSLESLIAAAADYAGDEADRAIYYRSVIVPSMDALRATADALETIMPTDRWPFISYANLLYKV